jgi:hypothetical protein
MWRHVHDGVTKREGPYSPALQNRTPDADLTDPLSIHPNSDLLNPDELQTEVADPFNYIRKVSHSPQHIIAEPKHTHIETHRVHLQNISCFNYRICTCREHKLSRKPSPKTSDPPDLFLHSLLSYTTSAAKQLTPSTRRSGRKIGNRQNLLYYSSHTHHLQKLTSFNSL